MRKIVLFLALLICLPGLSQSYDPAKVNSRSASFYTQAMERVEDENYPLAIGLLQKALQYDSSYADAWLSLGGIYGKTKKYADAVNCYEHAFAIDSIYSIEYK